MANLPTVLLTTPSWSVVNGSVSNGKLTLSSNGQAQQTFVPNTTPELLRIKLDRTSSATAEELAALVYVTTTGSALTKKVIPLMGGSGASEIDLEYMFDDKPTLSWNIRIEALKAIALNVHVYGYSDTALEEAIEVLRDEASGSYASLTRDINGLSYVVGVNKKQSEDAVSDLRTSMNVNAEGIRAEVSRVDRKLDGAVNTLNTNINVTAAGINANVSALEQTVQSNKAELQTSINVTAAGISANITSLTQTVGSNKTELQNSISATAASITANLTSLSQTVGANKAELQASITASAANINATISSLSQSVDDDKVELQASIDATAAGINTTISSLSQTVSNNRTELQTNIATTAEGIRTTIAALTQTVDGNKTELQTSISTLAGSVATKASATQVTNLGTRVSTAEQTISGLAGTISQKVSTTDFNGNTIASLINQSATTIAIEASKIKLVGAVSVLSDISGNLGNITAGSINLSTAATIGTTLQIGQSWQSSLPKAIRFGATQGSAGIAYNTDIMTISAVSRIKLNADFIDFEGTTTGVKAVFG